MLVTLYLTAKSLFQCFDYLISVFGLFKTWFHKPTKEQNGS